MTLVSPTASLRANNAAFSLSELLMVIAIIALLAGLVLPALGMAKRKADAARCVANMKQLQLAWTLYYGDHDDRITRNLMGASLSQTNQSWCSGWMRPGEPRSDDSFANPAYFMNAQLGSYALDARLFKCPSDKFVFPGLSQPYIRSVAMNNWMNGSRQPAGLPSAYSVFRRVTDMARPGEMFVFIHEDPNSIDDGYYAMDMSTPHTFDNCNLAAARHNGGTSMGFADGRAEIHRWEQTVVSKGVRRHSENSAEDAIWLKLRTCEPR